MAKTKDIKLNAGHYAELVQRLKTTSYIIQRQLMELPVAYQNKEWWGHLNAILCLTESLEIIASTQAVDDTRLDDRAFMLAETIYDTLVDHPELKGDEKALKLADAAGDALIKLCTHLATKEDNKLKKFKHKKSKKQ